MTTDPQRLSSLYIPPGTIYGPVENFSTDWKPDTYNIPCLYNRQENIRMSKILREECGLPIEMVHGWKRTYLDHNHDLWKYSVTFYHPDPTSSKGYHTIHKRYIGKVDESKVNEFLESIGVRDLDDVEGLDKSPRIAVHYELKEEMLEQIIDDLTEENSNLKTILVDFQTSVTALQMRMTDTIQKLKLDEGAGGLPE